MRSERWKKHGKTGWRTEDNLGFVCSNQEGTSIEYQMYYRLSVMHGYIAVKNDDGLPTITRDLSVAMSRVEHNIRARSR